MTRKNRGATEKPPVYDDRPDRDHPADEWWVQPYDGDTAAERDEWRHVSEGVEGDW